MASSSHASAAPTQPAVGIVGARVVIEALRGGRIAAIKAVRTFSLLGLSDVARMLDATPATFVVSSHEVTRDDISRSLDAAHCAWRFDDEPQPRGDARDATPTEAATSTEGMGVVLVTLSNRKIELIKLVRELTGLGLLDAKNAVEAPGSPLSLRTELTIEQVRARFEQLGSDVSFVSGCW